MTYENTKKFYITRYIVFFTNFLTDITIFLVICNRLEPNFITLTLNVKRQFIYTHIFTKIDLEKVMFFLILKKIFKRCYTFEMFKNL